MLNRRYILLTVDVEALSGRAVEQHVQRLVWGKHSAGTAGIREMSSIGDEFGAKHVFFADLCATLEHQTQMLDAVRWLNQQGQDVQLHAHPETLPKSFWVDRGLDHRPALMNEYKDQSRAEFVFRHFGKLISDVTGKPILAHRAGSFRWNALTIRALQAVGIPLSFNQSMRAAFLKRCPVGQPDCLPYAWSNGTIEVPVTERFTPSRSEAHPDRWSSLTYPESSYFQYGSRPTTFWKDPLWSLPKVSVVLMHSWSLLELDENGHFHYTNDRLLEGYRLFLQRIVKDYDVITTAEFLDLQARGKIRLSRTVNLEQVETQV
ncbi:polysaccharide deacetylase [Alcaligenes faecalis]|nr:polysaccharide deacetylase [Alcaligenes faecalis]